MSTKNSKYEKFVKEDILNNTFIKKTSPFHVMLGDCNIGVHMSHDRKKSGPYFSWVPSCFRDYCSRYGLEPKETTLLFWDWYSHVIIAMYMESPSGRRNYPDLF